MEGTFCPALLLPLSNATCSINHIFSIHLSIVSLGGGGSSSLLSSSMLCTSSFCRVHSTQTDFMQALIDSAACFFFFLCEDVEANWVCGSEGLKIKKLAKDALHHSKQVAGVSCQVACSKSFNIENSWQRSNLLFCANGSVHNQFFTRRNFELLYLRYLSKVS